MQCGYSDCSRIFLVVDTMAARPFVQFMSKITEQLITILNSNMSLVIQEFVDYVCTAHDYMILPIVSFVKGFRGMI